MSPIVELLVAALVGVSVGVVVTSWYLARLLRKAPFQCPVCENNCVCKVCNFPMAPRVVRYANDRTPQEQSIDHARGVCDEKTCHLCKLVRLGERDTRGPLSMIALLTIIGLSACGSVTATPLVVIEAGTEVSPPVVEAGAEVAPPVVEAGAEVAPPVVDAGVEVAPVVDAGVSRPDVNYPACTRLPLSWKELCAPDGGCAINCRDQIAATQVNCRADGVVCVGECGGCP